MKITLLESERERVCERERRKKEKVSEKYHQYLASKIFQPQFDPREKVLEQ